VKKVAETLEVSRAQIYEKEQRKMTPSPSKTRKRYKMPHDDKYLDLIRRITDERPTYGYRRVAAILNRKLRADGESTVNHKRVYQIMKMNNLMLQKHTGRPTRVHEGTIITIKSNIRWCSDAFEIACWNKERVRVAFCMDCSDREVISYIATPGESPARLSGIL